MEKDIIKQIILNQQESTSQVKLLPCKISIEKNGNYVFAGIRRVGKTYDWYLAPVRTDVVRLCGSGRQIS